MSVIEMVKEREKLIIPICATITVLLIVKSRKDQIQWIIRQRRSGVSAVFVTVFLIVAMWVAVTFGIMAIDEAVAVWPTIKEDGAPPDIGQIGRVAVFGFFSAASALISLAVILVTLLKERTEAHNTNAK